MACIVDVCKFLRSYLWDDGISPSHFVVHDPVAEWNNGVFGINRGSNVEPEINRQTIGYSIELDIRALSTLMSSKSPAYLHKLNYLCIDAVTLRLLEKLIPG